MKKTILALTASFAATICLFAQTDYTWTGAADPADGDWNNPANWDANGVPVDDAPGGALSVTPGSNIIFSPTATAYPTVNVPTMGGSYSGDATGQTAIYDSPSYIFHTPGTFTLPSQNTWWTNLNPTTRDIIVVGDGVGPAEEVNVTIDGLGQLGRHGDGVVNSIRVRPDGTLTLQPASGTNLAWARSNRVTQMYIDNAPVVVTSPVSDLDIANCFIHFETIGGSFTAPFGGDIGADIVAVESLFGDDFTAASGVSLEATDNLDGTFTVTAVTPPVVERNFWTGINGNDWDTSTTANFTLNSPSEALISGTFADVIAGSGVPTFADTYAAGGSTPAVATATVNIPAGQVVEAGLIEFINVSVPYVVASNDAVGISDPDASEDTFVDISAGGTVTLLGQHEYFGDTTLSNGSTLILGNSTAVGELLNSPVAILTDSNVIYDTSAATETVIISAASIYSGSGDFEKIGAGTLAFDSFAGYSGSTTITEGTLVMNANSNSSSFDIASGSTLEIGVAGGTTSFPTSTFTGSGTIRKTGEGTIRWGKEVGTFNLNEDALIDVQGGTFIGGSNANENWANNLCDLNLAAGALFAGTEANVVFDTLTGEGTFRTGFEAAGYVQATIGVSNGDATFNGAIIDTPPSGTGVLRTGNIRKIGTGTQILAGENTYTGNTVIEDGTLTFTSTTSSLIFAPGANNVSNAVLGGELTSGAVNLDGKILFDLSGAEKIDGNSWVIVENEFLDETYGATFSVGALGGPDFVESPADSGVWVYDTADADSTVWTFQEGTGLLTVESTFEGFSYATWAADFPSLDGTSQEDDSDGDGIANVLEYVLNGDPEVADTSILPTYDISGADLAFSFDRLEISDMDVDLLFQYSTDLQPDNWTDIFVSGVADPEVTVGEAVDGVQAISIAISKTLGEPDGKLFVRLNATLLE
ncbi:autotransporter-associated beta strand repeat-containing protein [Roseibacillus persicicus]|uniref:autotransporter-associated beta strand repeat-containing protein n=1 Tax=Roseibacillus persicicus TaxID=454148 RepID=UPI00280C88BF|nr:autotransporter-associated beta strand repeat-containing protein [Roseibacillus persicicus]MDQ8191133.1 autotransporter-associated beta strand repeat-containing protein [Roseibacillus persicicus]